MPYSTFTEINSRREGHFLERFAPGSLARTLATHLKRIRVLFEHGEDRSLGRQPIATFDDFRDAPDGAYYTASLLRGVPELLVEGLRRGVYGSSVRFNPVKVDRVRSPGRSAHNPDGLEERTIREARIYEFSVVTFPAYRRDSPGDDVSPRLKPQRARWRADQVLVALEEIPSHNSNSMRPAAYKGEVRRGRDALVKSHPELFAEAPVAQGEPGLNDPVAVPIVPFRTPDGRMIWPYQRFHLYDPIVLDHPRFFRSIIPND